MDNPTISIDPIAQYSKILKETIRGVRLRAFVFGYSSGTTHDYVEREKQRIWSFQEQQ